MKLYTRNGKVSSVCVDMGKPVFEPNLIPAKLTSVKVDSESILTNDAILLEKLPREAIINTPLTVNNSNYEVTVLSIGNPHCVVFCGFVDKVDAAQ